MANAAIVVGIDAYANSSWNLAAPSSDALRFAAWALGPGGVPRENLRLLLSPAKPHVTDLPYKEATRRSIIETINAFNPSAAADAPAGERLYVFWAGHGVSAPRASELAIAEPVLIPCDATTYELDYQLFVGFSQLMGVLAKARFPEQVFFIDACRDFQLDRDFTPELITRAATYSPGRAEAGVAQYVLYATALGLRAYEQRNLGVYTATLLEALTQSTPAAVWQSAPPQWEVSFSTLVEYIQERVRAQVENLATRQAAQWIQIPQRHIMGGAADPVLATFTQFPAVEVKVTVDPRLARESCTVTAIQYLPGGQRVERGTSRPPVPNPVVLDLPPSDYVIEARAERYRLASRVCKLFKPERLAITLEEDATLSSVPRGLPNPAGHLVVESRDQHVFILVRDARYAVVGSGSGHVELPELTPGIYHVRFDHPGQVAQDRMIEVLAGSLTTVALETEAHPRPQVGPRQLSLLEDLGLASRYDDYAHPAEALGAIANLRMASLLAFAACAAMWPGDDAFHRLRQLGVRDFADVSPERSALLTLIGVGGETPGAVQSIEEFLADGRLTVRNTEGMTLDTGAFELLARFPVVAQRGVELQPGPMVAELQLPGFSNTSYALAALPGRVTVLVVAVEATGEVAVQQYLFALPTNPDPMSGSAMEAGHTLRRIETAQRYYTSQQMVPDETSLRDLLDGKWIDPLLGCLAGYTLVNSGNPEQFRDSAMHNMLNFFPELPDSHILAGLYEPERRAEHFAAALTHGLPIFAEGFRALHAWYLAAAEPLPRQLVQPSRGLLPASPWTAWTFSRPALRVERGRFARPPFGWEVLEDQRAAIERVLPGVGRVLRRYGGTVQLLGTAFLVAPNVIMMARHMARLFCEQREERWVITPETQPMIDWGEGPDTENATGLALTHVLGIHDSVDLALFEVAPSAAMPAPIRLAPDIGAGLVGRRVYVVGYPTFDPRADPVVIRRVFDDTWQVKRLQPGVVLGVFPEERQFHHDCFTLGGNAGSCVVDVETNMALGLHLGGRHLGQQEKQNWAVALWMLRDDPLLLAAGIRWG